MDTMGQRIFGHSIGIAGIQIDQLVGPPRHARIAGGSDQIVA